MLVVGHSELSTTTRCFLPMYCLIILTATQRIFMVLSIIFRMAGSNDCREQKKSGKCISFVKTKGLSLSADGINFCDIVTD